MGLLPLATCFFRKKLRRDQILPFFSQLLCIVAMESCGGAHFWGREPGNPGHEMQLIPPAYAEPFVKRQKNDTAAAEAICEAAVCFVGDGRGEQKTLAPLKAIPSRPHGLPDHSAVVLS